MTAPAQVNRIVALAACLTVAAVSPAWSTGINLFWNDCSIGATATVNRNFACNSNAGFNVMTASFDPPPGIDALNGLNIIIDLQTAAPTLAQWWRFKNAGTCRLTSLSANTVFDRASCLEPWAGPGTAAIAAYLENYGGDPSRARIAASVSVTPAVQGPVAPGTEYYAENLVINNAKTMGDGSCSGCSDPVCIVLLEIKLTQPAGSPGGSPQVTNPAINSYITWQDGLINTFGCPGGSPVLNRTWGAVKSLYR